MKKIDKYPKLIFVELYPLTKTGVCYEKMYEHEGDGCYYRALDNYDVVTAFISLYPDKHLTYLWNGKENELNYKWYPRIS